MGDMAGGGSAKSWACLKRGRVEKYLQKCRSCSTTRVYVLCAVFDSKQKDLEM